jgi:hypothetical protein
VSSSTVTRRLRAGQLQGERKGRRWWVLLESIPAGTQDGAKRPRSRWWFLVIFLLIALPLTLLMFRVYGPLSSVVSSSRAVEENPTVPKGTDINGLPTVDVVPRKIDLTSREMLLEANIHIPGGTSAPVPRTFGGRSLITCPSHPPSHSCRLSPELDQARIAFFATANGNSTVVSDKSSGGILLHDPQFRPFVASDTLASFTIPIVGQGQDFPEDSYTGSVVISTAIVGDQWFPQSIPIPVFYKCCPQFSDSAFDTSPTWHAFGGPPTHILGETSDQVVVSISLHRSWLTIGYMYFLAIVPLAISVLLLWAVGSKEEDRPEQFLLGSVAATLAILPLRLVLVPNDVTGITRVDLLLAAGFLGLVGVGTVQYLRWR